MNKVRRRNFLSAITLAMTVVSVVSIQVQAQSTDAIDEIIITAQGRQQSAQTVPIAVSAYSERTLQRAGVDDITEVQNLTPSFQASSSSSETQGLVIRIRGIGTQGNNPAFESAVGVFIDGVYRARPGIALSELLDVERVEVLRGPQGTLFGRNTSAGALNIATKGPEFEFGGSLEALYGRFDEIDLRGSVTGPIIEDRLAVRLSVLYKERDGILDIVDNNLIRDVTDQLNDKDRYTLRGQALFTPTDNVSFRLIADYREQHEGCCYAATTVNGTAATIINLVLGDTQITPPDPFSRASTANDPVTQNVEDWGLSGELVIDLDWGKITSITAYRDFESFRQLDVDFTNADLIRQDREDGSEVFTQELRVQGRWGALDWLFGAYYADEQVTLESNLLHGADYETFINARLGPLVGAFFGPTLGATNYTELAAVLGVAPGTGWADGTGAQGDRFVSDNKSFSIFTHNVWNITEDLEFIFGGRVIFDDKHGVGTLDTNTPGCVAIQPALKSLPNLTLSDIGVAAGDQRRVKDVLASLGCLGIASPAFDFDLENDDDAWTGIVGFNYHFSETVMGYVTASRGYKAGGINLDRAGTILTLTGDNTDPDNFLDPRFDAEITKNIEIGLKTQLLNNSVNLNFAAFYMDLDNFQLNTFTGFNFTPENVEDATTKGFEVDISANLLSNLQFQGGIAYAKADYGKGITDLTNRLVNERGFRAGTTPLPEASPLAARQLTNAPRWVFTGALTYFIPIANAFEAFAHTDFRYSSAFNTGSDLDPQKRQDDFIVVNARIGIGQVDGFWQLELWAKNLFKAKYHQIVFDLPLQSNDGYASFLGDPQTFGATARATF